MGRCIVRQELLRRTKVLKRYENYGYRIAFYLLGDETFAVEASLQALMELIEDDDFFHQTQDDQKQQTKRVFMKHSLRVRANHLRKTKRQHA